MLSGIAVYIQLGHYNISKIQHMGVWKISFVCGRAHKDMFTSFDDAIYQHLNYLNCGIEINSQITHSGASSRNPCSVVILRAQHRGSAFLIIVKSKCSIDASSLALI